MALCESQMFVRESRADLNAQNGPTRKRRTMAPDQRQEARGKAAAYAGGRRGPVISTWAVTAWSVTDDLTRVGLL